MQRTYHVGLLKGSGDCFPIHQNGHRKSTLIVQARRSIDNLSPQLWRYCGERQVTKAQLRKNAPQLVAEVNKAHGTNFARAIID